MNVVYLIGNGFDLNLGMRTKWEHFYAYLDSCHAVLSPSIENLMSTVKTEKNKQNWSDFERELGKYLGTLEDIDEAVQLHDELIEHLQKYLEIEESIYIFDKGSRERLFQYLKNPQESGFLPNERKEFERHILERPNVVWNIKLITFNYTSSIERIINGYAPRMSIGGNMRGSNTGLEMEHVHGFTNNRMILGVNDISQIFNENFHNESRIIDRYIKSDCNSTYGLGHADKCKEWISDANLICVFGLSFGETDKKWWNEIGDALCRNCNVILFEHNLKTFNKNQGPQLKEQKNILKDKFLSKVNLNLDADFKKAVKEKIFVSYNTDMFKFDVTKEEKKHIKY